MGFRSTFVTQDYSIKWPGWFIQKYEPSCYISGLIASASEFKTYGTWSSLAEDIQKAINWSDFSADFAFIFVYLHECGGITRCSIRRDKITWSEPIGWKVTDGVEHNYCYGCSEVENGL